MNMGLKRKASFEESYASSSSPARSFLTSSESSTSNITQDSTDPALNLWNIAGAPYFNSRTRKRFRDGRPDEGTIHQNTLNKLYNAQRQRQTSSPDGQVYERQTPPRHPQPELTEAARFSGSVDAIQGPATMVGVPRDRSQRSLDSFFGSSSPESSGPSHEHVAALPAAIYQPQEHGSHLVPPHPPNMPAVLTCEGCGAPLLTKHSGEAVDAEMLDVDGCLVDPEVDDGWACALCVKRVCDVCAVRGDYRVCLECAVPGGGKYNNEELREKRWVGGIGWM